MLPLLVVQLGLERRPQKNDILNQIHLDLARLEQCRQHATLISTAYSPRNKGQVRLAAFTGVERDKTSALFPRGPCESRHVDLSPHGRDDERGACTGAPYQGAAPSHRARIGAYTTRLLTAQAAQRELLEVVSDEACALTTEPCDHDVAIDRCRRFSPGFS